MTRLGASVDLATAQRFLDFLDPYQRGSIFLWIKAQTPAQKEAKEPPDKVQEFLKTKDFLHMLPMRQNELWQPFVCVNATPDRRSKRKLADITEYRAYFLDFDSVEPKRAAEIYPPDMRVQSRNGQHWYWRAQCAVSKPSPAYWRLQMDVLATEFGGDMNACDPPRVMRVPGAYHLKNIDDPFLVTILEQREPPAEFPDRGDCILRAHGIDMEPYRANPPRIHAKAGKVWTGDANDPSELPATIRDVIRLAQKSGQKVYRNGNMQGEWVTDCPLRNHKSAKVVMVLQDDGEVRIFCQAGKLHGCTSDDILAAWGAGWGVRHPDRKKAYVRV